MKKVLITGGAGFIGSHLVDVYIQDQDYEVFVIDDLSMGQKENLPLNNPRLILIEDDICHQEMLSELLQENQFQYIFHLAAIASVADSVARPKQTHKVNFESTLLLLELVREYQKELKRFVFSSSAAVYGDLPGLPKTEKMPVLPKTPYAIDKYASERYVLSYAELYQIPTSAVRFFNVYGPRQNSNSPYSGVISIITDKLVNALQEKTTFNIFGSGEQTRDYINIQDVVQALQIVSSSEKSLGNVYNVGTGNAISLNNLLKEYFSISGVELALQYNAPREGDIKNSYSSIEALQQLGFEQKVSLEEGLSAYWKSIKIN